MSEVGFVDGAFFLDRLAPMEDPALLTALDDEGAVTWATDQVRAWYYDANRTDVTPATPPPGALRIGGMASALVLSGYFLAVWTCLYLFAIFTMPVDDSPLTVPGVFGTLLTCPFLFPALLFSWGADLLISKAGQASESSRALVIAGYRFFHGPLVTGAFALMAILGIVSAML